MEEMEWIKLPHDLQIQFFIHAKEESKRILDSIKTLQEKFMQ